MDSNFAYTVVRRSNYRWLALSLLGLAVVIAGVVIERRYLSNFVFGPFTLDRSEILATGSASDLSKYYLTIGGDEAFDTGYEYYIQYEDGHQKTDAYYIGLLLDDRVLDGVTSPSTASSVAVCALPSINNVSMAARVGSATKAAMAAMSGVSFIV